MSKPRDPAVFDITADLYSRIRPGYSQDVVEFVIEKTGLQPGARILELGCGPGLATEPFARFGFDITALDASGRMLDRARERLADFDNVRFVHSLFQDWEGEVGAFDLVYAGMAWHWMPQDGRDERVGSWLTPRGAIAVLTNWPVGRWEEGQDLYAEHWPDFQPKVRYEVPERIDQVATELAEAGVFKLTAARGWPWSESYSAEQYVNLLNTYSDHVELPMEVRSPFLAAVRERIRELGGTVERVYETVAMVAKPVGTVTEPGGTTGDSDEETGAR